MNAQHVKEEPYKCMEEEGNVTSINTADDGNKLLSDTASYLKFMQPTPDIIESTDQNLQARGIFAHDEEFAGLRQEYKRMTQSVAEHGGENIKSENCSENHHQQTDNHRIAEIHTPGMERRTIMMYHVYFPISRFRVLIVRVQNVK